MKYTKGIPGYLDHRLKAEILKTLIAFAMVAAVIILGIVQTGDRLNLLTVAAVLGALPACRMLVGVITRFPYRSIPQETANEILEKTPNITTIFDLIVTSTEKIMPVDCIAVSGNTVCGYTRSQKTDLVYAGNYIKNILNQNHCGNITVKIFNGYSAFLSRAEGMNSIAAVDRADTKRQEEKICQIIMSSSM